MENPSEKEVEECKAGDGEPCDCAACEREWQKQHDFWRPLWEGERAAGLV